jgi:hypothetical protein
MFKSLAVGMAQLSPFDLHVLKFFLFLPFQLLHFNFEFFDDLFEVLYDEG